MPDETPAGGLDWLRPHVLNANDGIVATAGIVEGLAGVGAGSTVILLGGIAGLVAGALAVAGTEYSIVATERDRLRAQLAAESRQLETDPEAELDELTQLYRTRGLSEDLARRVAIDLTAHDALRAHAELEHGIGPGSILDPVRDAAAAGGAFAVGGGVPLVMMALLPSAWRVSVTFVSVLLALVLTGWVSARLSDVHPVRPILRIAAIGAIAMAVTLAAGRLFRP